MLFRFSLEIAIALAIAAVGLATAADSHKATLGAKRLLDDASITSVGSASLDDDDDVSSFIVGGTDAEVGAYPYFGTSKT